MAQYEQAVSRHGAHAQQIDAGLRAHMNSIYGLMGVAMIVTGVVAWIFGQDLLAYYTAARAGVPADTLIVPPALLEALFMSPLRWVVIFAPLGLVFLLAARVYKMQPSTAQTVFYIYAGLVGLSLSTIFVAYTGVSIARTFFVTAIAFLGLSLYGYTTKKDLSGMGTFLMMGVIGLVVAMLVNLFLQSEGLQFAVSVLGVLIFAGLTAYDTQRLKTEYVAIAQTGDQRMLQGSAVSGALSLYLNFLNMFLFLLQFMGASRE